MLNLTYNKEYSNDRQLVNKKKNFQRIHFFLLYTTDELTAKILQKFQNKKTPTEIYFCLAAVHVTVTLNWETRAVLIYN